MMVIEADAFRWWLNACFGYLDLGQIIIDWIDAHSIDVVHCGECIHYDDGICRRPQWAMGVEPLDFCSFGERFVVRNE